MKKKSPGSDNIPEEFKLRSVNISNYEDSVKSESGNENGNNNTKKISF